ncbi:hypothetical protein CLIB1423_06S00540 [[Candida] railenensis]|uniref:Alcohol acetyltransferase n=1 Tax=[Candida] railenensis TaxID=45579 RepID=A0A9P0VY58_9ASCO|nr:hypothetical protein CLIB1423_06S00540 [[Candida] railenensis]
MTGPIITRPLSNMENFMRSRTATGFYRTFQLTATYSKAISKELLFKALRKSLIDYVMLTCNVFKAENHCYYHPIPRISFDDIVSFELDQALDETFLKKINEEIRFQLYANQPLFKVILLEKNQVCAVFEHTINDGVAGAFFHEILIENLAFIENDADQVFEQEYGASDFLFDLDEDKSKIKYSLPPPVDPFMEPYEVDFSDNDPNHYSKITPKGLTKWDGRFPMKREFVSSFKMINFTPEEVGKILKKCKENGVTLTSYIEVVHALTVQPIIGDNNYSVNKIALNLRKWLKSPMDANGQYKEMLSGFPEHKILGTWAHLGLAENLPPLYKFDWDLVKFVNENLKKTVTNTKVMSCSKVFFDSASKTDDNADFFSSHIGKPRPDMVKISNLGFVKIKTGDWEILDIWFSQDVAVIAADFMLSVVSSPKGGLNFMWSYIEAEDFDLTGFDEKFRQNMINCANL